MSSINYQTNCAHRLKRRTLHLRALITVAREAMFGEPVFSTSHYTRKLNRQKEVDKNGYSFNSEQPSLRNQRRPVEQVLSD